MLGAEKRAMQGVILYNSPTTSDSEEGILAGDAVSYVSAISALVPWIAHL